MADFVFKLSPNIVLGSYSSSRLGQFAKEWGSRFLLLIDPVLTEFKITQKVTTALAGSGIDFFVYDEIPPSPDTSIIQQVLELAREAHVQGIIAVGGTRVSNVARSVAALYHEIHDVYDFLEGASPSTASLPFLCVPTTLCDPFVFDERTPIIDGRSRRLKMLKLQPALCKLAVFDSTLTVSFTESQYTSMLVHCLCIAIESYTSQKSNFFSDSLIEKALDLLSFIIGDQEIENTTTPREDICLQASSMISLAAALSSIGVASGVSLAVNSRIKVSRSLTETILLPHIIEEVSKYKIERMVKVARLLKIETAGTTDEEIVADLAETIRNKIAVTNLPARLKDIGLSMEQLALVAENTAELATMYSFSRSMAADDIFEILKSAY